MIATITSKGQITIPLAIRERLGLKAGDRIDFDETAPVLTARRVIDKDAWQTTLAEWSETSASVLKDHPWEKASATEILDDLRGGPAEAE